MVFPKDANWSMRLKLARTMKAQTQEDVARIIGTTRKMIYLWETGKAVPRGYTRKKLAKWADVPEELLFKGLKN